MRSQAERKQGECCTEERRSAASPAPPQPPSPEGGRQRGGVAECFSQPNPKALDGFHIIRAGRKAGQHFQPLSRALQTGMPTGNAYPVLACLEFLAPGMGTAPLHSVQLMATCPSVLPPCSAATARMQSSSTCDRDWRSDGDEWGCAIYMPQAMGRIPAARARATPEKHDSHKAVLQRQCSPIHIGTHSNRGPTWYTAPSMPTRACPPTPTSL